MRILFFAGKGGVGKTSVAAATGINVSEMGYRTLIMSLDVAHSLADIFDLGNDLLDQKRGRPVKVGENLWIQELDVQEEIEKNWGNIHKYLSLLFNTTGLDEILAEELAVLPGMEEISLLLYINRYVKEEMFDVIILDCAPTGESIRFISIPTTLEWYIKKIFKVERSLAKLMRPLARRIYDVPLPGDDYFEAVAYLFERLRGVDKLLIDPEITTVRLVANPEKIVLKETQRAFMYFSLYHMLIDGIIMNRMLPEEIDDEFFSDWRDSQDRYMELADSYFQPVPIFPARLSRGEVFGYDALREFGLQIYQGKNPLDRFFEGAPYNLVKEDGDYRLTIRLPFAGKRDIELHRLHDELIVKMGSFKRHLLLPRRISAIGSIKARFEGEYLNIFFIGDENGKERR